jgi:hypothetical protein
MLARDKHSSFLRTFINYAHKKFYRIDPRLERPARENYSNLVVPYISYEEISFVTGPNVINLFISAIH